MRLQIDQIIMRHGADNLQVSIGEISGCSLGRTGTLRLVLREKRAE